MRNCLMIVGMLMLGVTLFGYKAHCQEEHKENFDYQKNTIKSGAKILPADLARILPLPGEYAGLAELEGLSIAIKIKEGMDKTNLVSKEFSEPLKPNPTDIIVKKTGKSGIIAETKQYQLIVESAESIPVTVVVNKVNLATTVVEEWELAMKAGRTIWLPEGMITVPVIESENKKIKFLLEYNFGKAASVAWDSASQALKWTDFNIRVKPALDKKK